MSVIKNLYRKYSEGPESFVVDIPHWEISDKGITALWGASGSGKSSVFRLLLGLDDCPGLKWSFQGENLAALPVPERRLGIVFQSLELFPHMTTEQNILFAAQARKVTGAKGKMKSLCERLKIDHRLMHKVDVLSGGERQRVALARALIGEPRFLFLDEPFSALDAHLKTNARNLIKSVIDEQNVPTLLVSHDEDDVKSLAHTIVKIEEGRIGNEPWNF